MVVEGGTESGPTSDVRFLINRIDITGNKEIATSALRALVVTMVGGEQVICGFRQSVEARYWEADRVNDVNWRMATLASRLKVPRARVRATNGKMLIEDIGR